MWRPTPAYDRVPVVWILLGLLFNAAGLQLGFEYSLSFVYMLIGWFCCAFGAAIFVLRLGERPRSSAKTRLSPKFVSAGATQVIPDMPRDDPAPAAEQTGTE